MRRQGSAIRDGLFADAAPARIGGRVIDGGGLRVHDIARTELFPESADLRVVALVRLFHGVEVVENSIEFVEAVHCREVLVAVAEMVFADLRAGVTHRLEQLGDGRIFILQALLGCGSPTLETGAKGGLTKDEGGASSGAGLLAVVVGEECAFAGDAVDVRGASAHHTAVISADIPGADIVGHDDDDVGFLGLRVCADGGACRCECERPDEESLPNPFAHWSASLVVSGMSMPLSFAERPR